MFPIKFNLALSCLKLPIYFSDRRLAITSRLDAENEVVNVYDAKNQNDVKLERKFYCPHSDRIAWHPSRSSVLFMPTPTTSKFTGMAVSAMDMHSQFPIVEFPIFSNQDLSLYTFNDNQPFVAVCNGFAKGSLGLIAKVDFQIPNY